MVNNRKNKSKRQQQQRTEPQSEAQTRDASKYKEEGNAHFAKKDFTRAAAAYKLGLALCKDNSTKHALQSNLALTFIKLESYQDAIATCNAALKEDPTLEKAWFRRALAKENLEDWHSAADDLQHCLQLFDQRRSDLTDVEAKMRKAVEDAHERVRLEAEKAPPKKTHDYRKQRQDVRQLLVGRKAALANKPTKESEALFVLDWSWWSRWCLLVDFFPATGPSEISNEQMQVLDLLPPGARLPPVPPQEEEEEENEDDRNYVHVSVAELGPIDNSSLLIESSLPFYKHWYGTSEEQVLRPNLVRGHHYELIPREVYFAFKTWYGELTDPICRRTSGGSVQLYPQLAHNLGEHLTEGRTHRCGACGALSAKSRCKQCLKVHYCNRTCQESHWPFHKQFCRSGTADNHQPSFGRVGLTNLGNTCFMNSALQCLSHATPLTRHFLSNHYVTDLNTQNPLGTGGKLAKAYEHVMREIWMKGPTTVSPTLLKRNIALFAPRFAGQSQHDAQEFLAYLLDGLHEDLNRVRKAPYVEMPDVGAEDPMDIAGAEAWDGHCRRNDSLVMDTFYGQFKSTCICPKCNRVSVSFDAFNHVSLEIPRPIVNRFIPIIVITGESAPIRYAVEVPRGATIRELRAGLSEMCGIPPKRIGICDIYQSSIYDVLLDRKFVDIIRDTDMLAAYSVDPTSDNTAIHVIGTHTYKTEHGRLPFGFPFLTSFNTELTCRDVWGHIWKLCQHASPPSECLVKLNLVDDQGNPRAVFPGDSSSIPRDSEEQILQYLGADCTEQYLYMSMEWDGDFDRKTFAHFSDHPSVAAAIEKDRGNQEGISLDKCFETFTRPERLDENNKWYCNQCREHVRAKKTMKLWRLPNILVVHLKRFEFKNAIRREKLSTFVDYPISGLDMSKHCGDTEGRESFVKDDSEAIYDLFAVVNHYGRLGYGHYTAFARCWDEEGFSTDWAKFDDSNVHTIGDGKEFVVNSAAYVLFYRRRKFN